jgi:cardiolipin-specific phospholipase
MKRISASPGKGPPGWAKALISWGWEKNISPFSFARFAGRTGTLKFIAGYVKNRQKVDNEDQASAIRDYMYQVFMRPGTTESALMMCFELGFYSKVTPLGHPDKLLAMPIPVSFIYGENDWVKRVDKNAGKIVIEASQNPECKYYEVTNSDHNMHMDNPMEFSNIIINDIFPDSQLQTGFAPQEEVVDFENEFY